MGEGRSTRWHNFPIPEVPTYALGVAVLLRLLTSGDSGRPSRWRLLLGSGLVLGGGLLATWATNAAADTDLEQPDRVVDAGPYAHSRHPMYLAWTGIYLGVALLANLAWAWLLLPVMLALTHREVLAEEDRLRRTLTDEYLEYAGRVPRYLYRPGPVGSAG
jgi:protein-S-isoprenylcysteine O-methyltransferase Ste14